MPQDEDLVGDGWTDAVRSLGSFLGSDASGPEKQLKMELADLAKMNQIRTRIERIVEDPATAEALKPWYRQFCKRPTFNDEYLPAFNRPNLAQDIPGYGVRQAFQPSRVRQHDARMVRRSRSTSVLAHRMAEGGASQQGIKAVGGWSGDAEVAI